MTSVYAPYLFAWVFWLGLSIGLLGLLLLHRLFDSRWGEAIEPVLRATTFTLVAMLVAGVPLLTGLESLYPWVHNLPHRDDAILNHRAPYLNLPFFFVRGALYFVVWIGLAAVLSRRTPRGSVGAKRASAVSAPGTVAFVLTVTFAMTDWVMSLDAHWISTVYGVWLLSGQLLAAVALAAVVYAATPALREHMPQAGKDLGNLMLAFTMFWGYISLSQYLIIWSGNLPEETPYYIRRATGGWEHLGALLMLGQFLVPFVALLSGRTKRTPRLLGLTGAWVLGMHVADVFWIVLPSARGGSAMPRLLEVGALLAIGAVWMAAFLYSARRTPPASAPTAYEEPQHA